MYSRKKYCCLYSQIGFKEKGKKHVKTKHYIFCKTI